MAHSDEKARADKMSGGGQLGGTKFGQTPGESGSSGSDKATQGNEQPHAERNRRSDATHGQDQPGTDEFIGAGPDEDTYD